MNALDVLCAQLTRDLFAIAKFLLTIGRLLLHCWYSLGRPVTIGTPMVIFAVLTVFWLFLVLCWYTVGTVLLDMWRLVHQWSFLCCFDCFWRLVHCWYSLGRPVTIGTAMVIFAVLTVFWLFLTNGTLYRQKQSKDSQNKHGHTTTAAVFVQFVQLCPLSCTISALMKNFL